LIPPTTVAIISSKRMNKFVDPRMWCFTSCLD